MTKPTTAISTFDEQSNFQANGSPARTPLLLLLVLVWFGWGADQVRGQTWVEESFDDFADGRLDASGQNLYVSRDGKIRPIHRFDLNEDGYLDLVFTSNHDTYHFIPATLATVMSTREVHQTDLAVEGSLKVAVADLNRDGYPDLVFCPNQSGVQTDRRFLTIISGGEDGWPAHRSHGILPVNGVTDVVIADLNHDGWPDIVTLNSEAWLTEQQAGRVIRIYWGSEEGFLIDRMRDLSVHQAIALAAGDFDNDGARDVAILTASGSIRFLWASKSGDIRLQSNSDEIRLPGVGFQSILSGDSNGDGYLDLHVGSATAVYLIAGLGARTWGEVIAHSEVGASHMSLGDLDGNGLPDLILIQSKTESQPHGVRIVWGRDAGFRVSDSLLLEIDSARASAVGDLDGDRCLDLAVAVYQGSTSLSSESVVFFGNCQGLLKKGPSFRTEGATHAAIIPADGKSSGRVIFSNSLGGTLREEVPLLIYWGGPGGFDPNRRLEIPFRAGYEVSSADLNADGFVDLIALPWASDPTLGPKIFWGSEKGLNLRDSTILQEPGMGSSNVADLDRDGYLDVVLGTHQASKPEPLVIYYGSPAGYEENRRKALKIQGDEGASTCGWVAPPSVADFNRDDWLDIAATCTHTNSVYIFWGGPEGFSSDRWDRLRAPGPYSSEVADLNGDGYLDLIVGTFNAYKKTYDTGTLIFWGSPQGFRPWNAQWLPGFWTAGSVVADFDGDGFLDLFLAQYHAHLTRESLPSYIYWGGPRGFGTRQRTVLTGDSVHDAVAGDFDQDGRLDLALSCHTDDGDHRIFSKVYFNDGNRFTNPRVQRLPTRGTHWMWGEDLGHIYSRSWRQTYESSLFNWEGVHTSGRLGFKAEKPGKTKLLFEIRSAATAQEIYSQPWRDLFGGSFSLESTDRCLQYRAIFISDNGDRYPELDRISIELNP